MTVAWVDPSRLTDDGCGKKHLPASCQRCFDQVEWSEHDPIFPNQTAYIATCPSCGLAQQISSLTPLLPPGQHEEG